MPEYGQEDAADTIEGIELLQQYKQEHGSDVEINNSDESEEEGWVDVEHSSDEDETENQNAPMLEELGEIEEIDEQEGEDEMEDEEENVTEQLEESIDETEPKTDETKDDQKPEDDGTKSTSQSTSQQSDTQEKVEKGKKKVSFSEEEKTKLEQSKEEAKKILTTRLLTDEEIALLKKLKKENPKRGQKRKLEEVVDVSKIEAGVKISKGGVETVEKEKFKHQRKPKAGGKTNKEKRSTKNFNMIKHSKRVRSKFIMGQKEKKKRAQASRKKQLKFKLKVH